MTEKALKKILTMTVMKEFPVIENIFVTTDDLDYLDNLRKKEYKVWFGIAPDNITKVKTEDVRQKIRDYSSYILDSNKEKLTQILLYNPKDWK
jgi:hypothetical protein